MNLESCVFALNKCMVIGKNLVLRKKGLCCFVLRAFGFEV